MLQNKKSFYILVWFVLSFGKIWGDEAVDPVKLNLLACGEELGLQIQDHHHPVDFIARLKNPEYKCLTKCLLQKFGIIDSQGHIKSEKLTELSYHNPPTFQETFHNCMEQFQDVGDLCERYTKVNTCVMGKH